MSSVSRACSRAHQLPVKLGTCLCSRGTQAQANESCMPRRCAKPVSLCHVTMQDQQGRSRAVLQAEASRGLTLISLPRGQRASCCKASGIPQPLKTVKSKWLLVTLLTAIFLSNSGMPQGPFLENFVNHVCASRGSNRVSHSGILLTYCHNTRRLPCGPRAVTGICGLRVGT